MNNTRRAEAGEAFASKYANRQDQGISLTQPRHRSAAKLYTTKMSMCRTLVIALALALSSYAQTKPNFSGNWKLNLSKSDFGMMPTHPDSRNDVIDQTEGVIKDTVSAVTEQGNQNYTLTIKTDGTESAVKLGGRDVKVSATWAGPALAVTTKLDFDGNDIVIKSNWTLSEDGNTWTQSAHITSPMGETDTKMVFDKQAGGAATDSGAGRSMPATASTVTAGAKPNFSGIWKLNVAKSDFGPIPGPEGETDTIEHNEPNLKLAVDRQDAQGKQQFELAMMVNGKEEAHKLGDHDVKTTAQWEGNALVVSTKLMFQDNEVLMKSAYMMAPDGKTVNVNTHFSSAMGEADQKLVFEKQ